MPPSQIPTIFYGPVVNPRSISSYQALPNCLLAIGPSGDIEWIEEDVHHTTLEAALARRGSLDVPLVILQDGEFILPGFVDTHTHAPQVPNIGSGQQYELLDWLTEVTFPMETRFADVDFARRAYELIVKRIINSGTTTCCYYGTLHLEATKVLADIIHVHGQRAFVGKCNMDRNSPDNYVEPSVSDSIAATHALISHIRSQTPPRLVEPILTPRFAISCTGPLLSQLGTMARADPTLPIQTHISENRNEVLKTLELFPEATSYADVYDSGVCAVGNLIDRGIKVGLGTDVSGGFSPSILTAIQHASIASKISAVQPSTAPSESSSGPSRQFSLATLLHLATLGGAQVCGLEDRVGTFTPGKAFDALLVSVRSDAGNPALWGVDLDQHSK
ncbi:hypothetical protein BGW80DRAFT_1454222 [Lactifluus volemus]|nr:hypothetical protein BGW80DRAFT_1454222 [Lactifluus volemus]